MANPLSSLLEEPRATPPPPQRVWRDWVLLAAVVLAALLEGLLRTDLPLRVLSMAVCIGLAPTLLWRRTRPFTMVAIAFGTSTLVDIGLLVADAPALDMVSMIYFLILPYALFRWGSGREVAHGLAIILLAAATGFLVSWTGFVDLIGGGAVLFSSMALGLVTRTQHGVHERRLEKAKTEERVQLARELHDTVGHHVSAIAIQAQAGRALAATDPAASLEALTVIETEATRTLAEMRAMVRMLRNQEPAEYAPQPGVWELERLAIGSTTGPPVVVTLTGDLVGLPTAVDSAVYRIALEAVTNARQHARNATRVDVSVDAYGSTVHLNVHNDGDPATNRPLPGAGYGLTGMAERAALLGGTCVAGPGVGGGWTVDAILPWDVPR